VSEAAPTDEAVAGAILALTTARGPGRTICPSEAARAVAAGGDRDWRGLMPAVRRVAAALAAQGVLRITQRGEDVDIRAARGPIRLERR
jgi:Protein of unknown function (DUF3253)